VLVFISFSHGHSAILAAKLMIKLDLLLRLLATLTWTWWSLRFVQPWAPWIWIQPVVRVVRDVAVARPNGSTHHRLQTQTHTHVDFISEPLAISVKDTTLMYLLLTTREAVQYIILRTICLSVCMYVYVCNNFRKPWHRKFIFAHPVHLERLRVKFVYEGHRVKFKVTGAKRSVILIPAV